MEFVLSNQKDFDLPLDHMLFNPAMSAVPSSVGVGMVVPALAEQEQVQLSSEIRNSKKSLSQRLLRGAQEAKLLTHFLRARNRGARWMDVEFKA